MNSFWNLVKEIPLSNFLLKTPYQEVLENLDNHEKGILTKNSKLFLSSLFGWGISLFSTINWFVFPVSSSLIILANLILFLRSKNFFKEAAYSIALYVSCQTALIFYVASIKVSNTTSWNRIASTTYILISFLLVLFVVKTKLMENLQARYLPDKKMTHFLSIKMVKRVSKFIVIFIALYLAALQFFRVNKWWLRNFNPDLLSGLNGTFLGNILSIISVIIGLVVLMLVTLIPTILLDIKVIVTGLLLRDYSEEVRNEYGFTEKEWYGEE